MYLDRADPTSDDIKQTDIASSLARTASTATGVLYNADAPPPKVLPPK